MSAAIPICQKFEQCRLTAWLDTVAVPPRWTIGWGYAGSDVIGGMAWSQEQADANLEDRLLKLETEVRMLVTVPLNDEAIGALVSLADNAGIGIENHSRLIAKVNARDWSEAAYEIIDDDHVRGVVVQGLMKRRCYEAYVFLDNVR